MAYLFAIANQVLPLTAKAVMIMPGGLQMSIVVTLVLIITVEVIHMIIMTTLILKS